MQMTPPSWQKERRREEPLDESERGDGKVGLKFNIQKTKIMASGPITSWETDRETVEILSDFILGGSKITAYGDCSHEIKRRLLLGRKVMTNLDSITNSMDMNLSKLQEIVKDREAWPASVHGVVKSQT